MLRFLVYEAVLPYAMLGYASRAYDLPTVPMIPDAMRLASRLKPYS